jgi:hypothetical protein
MRTDFSEFSFGYALTHEITNAFSSVLRAAPVFPSLLEEGRDGGYDLQFDIGFPLFLQFKLCEYMMRPSAQEWSSFSQPYYRFTIRARKNSKQHDMLLALERQYGLVYYSVPAFQTTEDLNTFFFSQMIIPHVLFLKPSSVGNIIDDDEHNVAFNKDMTRAYCFSKPKEIILSPSDGDFVKTIATVISERISQKSIESNLGGYPKITRTFFENLSREMKEIAVNNGVIPKTSLAFDERQLIQLPPSQRAAYISRTLFQSELIIVIVRDGR